MTSQQFNQFTLNQSEQFQSLMPKGKFDLATFYGPLENWIFNSAWQLEGFLKPFVCYYCIGGYIITLYHWRIMSGFI
jgi:hypothetical protein